MNILAGKQVGPIYYMVKDTEILQLIVEQGVIRTSVKAEPTGKGNGSKHYISFMRDLTKADRNPNRWIYGIQLDGDKLSNKYKIEPYSFAGSAMKKNYYKVKTLISYDDNTYALSLVNWPTIKIPQSVFEDIKELITSDSQNLNKVKKLEVTTGKRPYLGRTIKEKYNYDVKTGGISLNEKNLSLETLNYLLKHTNLNETEERIWIIDEKVKFINIGDCITCYIEPKGDDSIEQKIENGGLPKLKIQHY